MNRDMTDLFHNLSVGLRMLVKEMIFAEGALLTETFRLGPADVAAFLGSAVHLVVAGVLAGNRPTLRDFRDDPPVLLSEE